MTKQLHFLGFSLNKCFLRTVKCDGDIIKVEKKCSKRLSGKSRRMSQRRGCAQESI